MEFIIVTIFWGVLLPVYLIVIRPDPEAMDELDMEATTDIIITSVIDHSFVLIFLFIDWSINSIQFDYRHLTIIYFIGVIYITFNVVWCELTKKYIYPIMDWSNDPIASSIAVLGVIFLMTLVYACLKCCTDRKLRKYKLS